MTCSTRLTRLVRRSRAGVWIGGMLTLLAAGVVGCGSDDGALPPNIPDPTSLQTPAGAIARYRGTQAVLGGLFVGIVSLVGVMTDELAIPPTPTGVAGTSYAQVDARTDFTAFGEANWNRLHRLRAQAREARGFLAAYAPNESPALQGEMQALEGYADLFLADLFCSGIPLSTVNFDGSFTLASGSTTAEVYERARGLFDSALAVAGDSANVQQLAAVGKGRSLLALGRYADAATTVAAVPDGYIYYTPRYSHNAVVGAPSAAAAANDSSALWYWAGVFPLMPMPGVASREGQNGLDYRSSGDPRSSFTTLDGVDPLGNPMYFPAKYTVDVGSGTRRQLSTADSFVVASGVEARLIEAEAAFRANAGDGQWLATLNHLRQTMWTTIVADTVSDPWMSGPGPLPDLADPGVDSARVSLLFRERAMWLFLTGHRQGDLRRLIRQYPGHPQNRVYPTGTYTGGGGLLAYGDEVVIPVPESERQLNSQYTGCIDRNP